MKIGHKFKNKEIILFILFLTLNLQLVSLAGLSETNDFNGKVKLYIIVTLIVSYLAFVKRRIVDFNFFLVVIYLFFVILSSIVFMILYNFNFLYLNYIFCLVLFLISFRLGEIIDYKKIVNVIKSSVILIYLIVLFKLMVNFDKVIQFLSAPYGHPDIPVIYGGGVNLEATYIALSSVFFFKDKKYYLLILFSIVLSSIYASRVGLILSLLSFGFYSFSMYRSKNEKRIISIVFSIFVFFGISFFIQNYEEIYVLNRISQVGTDAGSQGRFNLWQNVLDASIDNLLLGYGPGNAVYALEQFYNYSFIEDNLHNIYLQNLLDFGIFGLFFFLIVVFAISITNLKQRFKNMFGVWLLLFFIAGLIQFRGANALMYFMLGLYISSYSKNNINCE